MKLLPEYFRPILEFKELMKIDSLTLDELEKLVERVYKNNFIQTADAATLKSYEGWFGITYIPGETLEYRRQRIMQMFTTFPPFSEGYLRNKMSELYGNDYTLEVDPAKSALKAIITSSKYGAVDLFYGLIWDIVPAHIDVTVNHQVTNFLTGRIYSAAVLKSTYIQTI